MGASGGRYLPITPPSALLVRHQLALALETSVDRVDPSLEAVVVRFCDASPFWLREILAFIVLYGLEEFLADMTGNRRHPEDVGQGMAIGRITSLTSIKAIPRRLSVKRGAIAAADLTKLAHSQTNLLPQSNSSPPSDSLDKPPPTTTRFATYLPVLMRRLSLGTISQVVVLPASPKRKGRSLAAEIETGVTMAGGGGTNKAAIAMTAPDDTMSRRNTSFHANTATAVPFQGNPPAINSPNSFDIALAKGKQPSNRSVISLANQPSNRSLPHSHKTAGADPGTSAVAGITTTTLRTRKSFTHLQIPHHSMREVGTKMSALGANIVNGVKHGALVMSEHGARGASKVV